jgi:transcriptional regulator with XRE-family HTH domain
MAAVFPIRKEQNNYLEGKCATAKPRYDAARYDREARVDAQFGEVLKEWRGVRRMSQLNLGLAANVSARHISFLETGRARPSRPMVLQLAETLEVPRPARNRLLNAAGFRPAYAARPAGDAELSHVNAAIDRIIGRHDPYPAFVIDRHWLLVRANVAGTLVLGAMGIPVGTSMLDAMTEPGRGAAMIENWGEVAAHMVQRLRTESTHLGGDDVLDAAIAKLLDDPALPVQPDHGAMPAVVPARYRIGEQRYSVFSVFAQFGSAEDIALADLRIEMLFPADAETGAQFDMLSGGAFQGT